jgi:hypothetical protein
MNDELGNMWKEAVVAYCKVLSHSPGAAANTCITEASPGIV